MTAPTDETTQPPTRDEAIERVQTLVEDDRTLRGVIDTGGQTEYAHIYLGAVTGTHNGNQMLWLRYIWLSKPGAYESDMWGDNGISMRMVDGMPAALKSLMLVACGGLEGADQDKVMYDAL